MAISLPNNINKQLSNVNMSNVTQAAQQSGMTGTTQNAGTTRGAPTSNTALYNAGTTTSSGQPINAFAQAAKNANMPGVTINQQGNIQGQTNTGGGGPGGISKGSYSAQSLSQDQRNWLWSQFGHSGQAPVGYGGENTGGPSFPLVDTQKSIQFQPSPVLPASQTAVAGQTPKSPTGSTQQPLSIAGGTGGATSGGAVGQAFGAQTPTSQATQGLQLSGLPGNFSGLTGNAGITPQNMGSFMSQFGNQPQTGTQKPTTMPKSVLGAETGPQPGGPGATPVPGGALGQPAQPMTGALGQPVHSGSWAGLPDFQLTEKLSQLLGNNQTTPQGGSSLKGMTGIPGLGTTPQAQADINLGQLNKPGALSTSVINQGGGITQTPVAKGTASTAQMPGSLAPAKGIKSYISGKADLQTAASSIATPQALPAISQAMSQAQSSGDMATVGKLADLFAAVQTNLKFQDQINQIVTALSAGFGTPQSQDVTSARTPMIQQGIGGALTAPLQAQVPQMGQNPTSQTPYMPPSLQTVTPNQQNTPILKPFMS